MRVRVRECDFAAIECSTRLPFRFGITTMTESPLLLVRLRVETEGIAGDGFASDLLVPKWFEKDPAKSIADDQRNLLRSARGACADAIDLGEQPSVFALWRALEQARVEARPRDAPDRLVRGFGVALVERACLDAASRAAGVPFAEFVRSGGAGFAPDRVHAELAGAPAAAALAAAPLDRVHVRHTVGLADPLRRGDRPAEARVDDGLPETLEDDVTEYGLRYFKIKIAGEHDADLDRLRMIDEVVRPRAPEYRFTLDGNEQLDSIDDLRRLLDALGATDAGAAMRRRLLYVEQPLARRDSFDADRLDGIRGLGADVIIDEADTGLDAFPRALACGYRGVSVKNCKGVFRALANRLLAERHGGFLSAEDLTNLPVTALQQDLATVATLGLAHVERNGHHYFRGLDHLCAVDADNALAHHADLYAPVPRGGAALRIEDGVLRIGSLQCPGYGVAFPVHFEAWPSVATLAVEAT